MHNHSLFPPLKPPPCYYETTTSHLGTTLSRSRNVLRVLRYRLRLRLHLRLRHRLCLHLRPRLAIVIGFVLVLVCVSRTWDITADKNSRRTWRSSSETWPWWCPTDRSSSGWSSRPVASWRTSPSRESSSRYTSCARNSWRSRSGSLFVYLFCFSLGIALVERVWVV